MITTTKKLDPEVSQELLDAIAAFPLTREIEHCGTRFAASPFAMYAICPHCGTRLKVRSFAAVPEIEDVFDAVFAWMNQSGASALAQKRQSEIAAEPD